MSKIKIIAEIGSNLFKYHSSEKNLKTGFDQIEAAKAAGANAVKFQMFCAEELWGPECKGKSFAKYQDRFALPPVWLNVLKRKCTSVGIEFMCSGFSVHGFKTIAPYVSKHKLASPEATSKPIVDWLMDQPKPVIASLGCMRKSKIDDFLERLRPGKDIVLECVSEYPAREIEYDLIKMVEINKKYCLKWGISDHTKGTVLAEFARSLGATYFEKHVDFLAGVGSETPDTEVSTNGLHFEKYVKNIGNASKIDYDVKKKLAHKLYAHRKSDCGYNATWNRPMPEWE
jgi:N-acetylneuraminate synthase